MVETHTSLLERVRNSSDSTSWGEFVALYEPLLFQYVRKRGLHDHDAQDVVQGIFIALLRALRSFELDKKRGRFRTWLWQVAANAVTDWHRRQRRLARAEERWREDKTTPPEEDEEWKKAHRQRVKEFILDKVREQTAASTWACFQEHLLRGRPGAEVGAELGLSANTVYVNASRVLARIKQQSAFYLEELGDD